MVSPRPFCVLNLVWRKIKAAILLTLFTLTSGFIQTGLAGQIVVSTNSGWNSLAPIPSPTDTIVINNGANLTVNTNGVCASIQIGGITIGSGDGILTFVALSQVSVSGNVILGSIPRNGTVDMSNGGTLVCRGIKFSAGMWTPGSGTLRLTTSNTLPDTNAVSTFNNLIISNGTTTLSRGVFFSGDLSVNGGMLDLTSFSATRLQLGGTFTLSNGAALRVSAADGFPSMFSNYNLGSLSRTEYAGANQTVAGMVYGDLILSGSGVKTVSSQAIANGVLVVNSGVTFSIATLPMLVGDKLTINGNVTGSGLVLSGTPGTAIDGSGTIAAPVGIGANKIFAPTANLTFSSTISISGNPVVTNYGTVTVTVSGGITGTLASSWTNASNSTLNIAGQLMSTTGIVNASAIPNTIRFFGPGISQIVKGTTYYNLIIDKTNGTAALGFTTTVNGNLTIAAGTLATNNRNLVVAGMTDIAGTLKISGGTNGNLAFAGISVDSAGTFDNSIVHDDVTINGSLMNRGSFLAGSGIYSLTGSTTQVLSHGNLSFNSLVINNPSGIRLVEADAQIDSMLSLLRGTITTGPNLVTIMPGAFIVRDSGYVAGNLRKTIPSGSYNTQFEVGDSNMFRYAPARIFAAISSSGDMIVCTVSNDHPNIGSSGLNSSKTLNRYWSISKSSQLTINRIDSIEFQFDLLDRDIGLVLSSEEVAAKRNAQNMWSGNFGVDSISPTRLCVKPGMYDLLDVGDYQIGMHFLSVNISNFQEDTTVVATMFPNKPSVQVTSAGTVLEGKIVVFSVVLGSNGASASFTDGSLIDSATTNILGVASADFLIANTIAGLFTVQAWVVDGSNVLNFSRTNLPGPPSADSSTVRLGRDTLIANGFDTTAVVIQLRDHYGNPTGRTQDSIQFAISNPQLASLVQPTYVSAGQYVGDLTATHVGGHGVISASINGSPVSHVAHIQFLQTAIAITNFSEDTTIVATAFAHVPIVQVTSGGIGREGTVVVFNVDSGNGGASARFSNGSIIDSVITDSQGLALSSSLTANTKSGTFTIRTWTVDASDTVNFFRTNLPGPSSTDSSTVALGRDTLVANGLDTTSVVIQLRDQYGNPINANRDSVRISINNSQLASLVQPVYVAVGQYVGGLMAKHIVGQGTISVSINGFPISDVASIRFLADSTELPTSWLLGQNYPNPFNGETTIHFSVPNDVPSIQISFYDLLGRRVMTYRQRDVQHGKYELKWRGINDEGKQLSSGVYFYQLELPTIVLVKRLVLLR